MDDDHLTKMIMERVRNRRDELGDDDDKENTGRSYLGDSAVYSESPSADTNQGKSPVSPWKNTEPVRLRETNIDADLEQPKEKRRSAFSDLAAEFDNFKDDTSHHEKPKEAYIRGPQRLSIGERRSASKSPVKYSSPSSTKSIGVKSSAKSPSVLPTVAEQEDERRIRFAQPICATNVYEVESSYSTVATSNDSSIVAGNMHYSRSTTYSKEVSSASTLSDDVTSSDVYGAHTFIRKKSPHKVSSSSLCSPQPFNRDGLNGSFSSVQFNPTMTSSPKLEESTVTIVMSAPMTAEIGISSPTSTTITDRDVLGLEQQANDAVNQKKPTELSPSRSTAIENATAKTMAQKLENKLKTSKADQIPLPSNTIGTFATTKCLPNTEKMPSGVKTQWRGAAGTPVVSGANSAEPTKPDVRASNIKSLRNRWEFSSSTGTPLHPDETEDELLRAAIRMRDTAIPRKTVPQTQQTSSHTTPVTSKPLIDRSATNSPVSKSPRYSVRREATPSRETKAKSVEPEPAPAPIEIQEPEPAKKENCISDDEGSDDDQLKEDQGNISKFIDDAFDFMAKSPASAKTLDGWESSSTPNYPAPLATMEETPAVLREASPHQSEAVPNTPSGSGLHYTISYYRKRVREQRSVDNGVEKVDLSLSTPSAPQIIGLDESTSSEGILLEKKKDELEKIIFAQKTRIPQASKALQLCRERPVLRESPEEAEAQLRVLVETERYRAAAAELDRLNRQQSLGSSGPRGQIIITAIQVSLRPDFLRSINRDNRQIYYFAALFKLGEHVFATKNVSSDHADQSKSAITFQGCSEAPLFNIDNISPDFVASLEIYFYRTQRGQYSHEEKYNLECGSSKKTLSKQTGRVVSTGTSSLVVDSSYSLAGKVTFDITTPSGKSAFGLSNVSSPLEGGVTVSMKKRSQDQSSTSYRGFLSMFQRTKEGLGSWNRYYCVLEGGEMKFWRCPEDSSDDNDKKWLVLLDLRTCASDGASTVREVCPYPNSFHIDVWVPKSNEGTIDRRARNDMEKLRVMMAADTKSDMNIWLENINHTVKQLLMWRRPVQ